MEQEKKETISLDFTEVEIRDLKGNKILIKDFNKEVANTLFINAPTIPIKRMAETFYDTEKLEVNFIDLLTITEILKDKWKPLISEPLSEYLKAKVTEMQKGV
jgi:hypothetical protein